MIDAATVFAELNLARTKPAAYADHLAGHAAAFKPASSMVMKLENRPIGITTQEGKAAVDEAIAFLKAAKPIPAIKVLSKGLNAAAADMCAASGPTGVVGHTAPDGSSPFDRIDRRGKWQSSAAENIAYGSVDARDAVVSLIIDDGVASRGHRKNIFNEAFNYVGIASGSHSKYDVMVVMNFAGGFSEEGEAPTAAMGAMSVSSAGGGAAAASSAGGGAAAAVAVGGAAAAAASAVAPPGGTVSTSTQTEVKVENGKKTTTTTTVITTTDAKGNKSISKKVSTMVESA